MGVYRSNEIINKDFCFHIKVLQPILCPANNLGNVIDFIIKNE